MAKAGKGSKAKGANAEREVAALLQPIIDVEYEKAGMEPPQLKRNLEQTRSGGHDLVGIDWLAIEVKRVEQLSIEKWWKQTVSQASEMQLPVLIYRQNGKKWRVITNAGLRVDVGKWVPIRAEMSLEEFLKYFRIRIRYSVGTI